MAMEKIEFKRIGKVQAIDKFRPDFLPLQITLDGSPNGLWIKCFKNPKTFRGNEVLGIEVKDNIITFREHESQVKETLGWIENYISQANTVYKAQVAEYQARQKREKEQEQAKKAELDRINESLKDL